MHPELGGNSGGFDVIGINYYDRNQWWNYGETIRVGDPAYRAFSHILSEVYGRYSCPLFIAETGTENGYRPDWFAYIAGEVRKARALGVPVHGICLYPISTIRVGMMIGIVATGCGTMPVQTVRGRFIDPCSDEICKQEKIRQQQDSGEVQ